jgi:hypothetical protein
MYVWNTGTVIAQHVETHINHPEIFQDYYEHFQQQGHFHIGKNTVFKVCHQFIKDPECIAQLITLILEQENPIDSGLLSTRQYILDFQGFKISANEYIMREFCLVACDATLLFHCMVKLPCESYDLPVGYQRQVEWLTRNLHGLHWDTTNGYTVSHIRHIVSQCCEMGSVFYCKGSEKMTLLQKLFHMENIVNVEDQGCPALRALSFKLNTSCCNYHQPVHEYACALRNCMQLQFWLKIQASKVMDGISTIHL